MKIRIKIKPIITFLEKRWRFLAFCLIMLIVLGVGLIINRFVNNVLISQDSNQSGNEIQELRVDMRLYREVIARMNEDTGSDFQDLNNPFLVK